MRSKKIRFKVLGLDACPEPIKGKKKLRLVAWETIVINKDYFKRFLSPIEKIKFLSSVYIVNFDMKNDQQGKDNGLTHIKLSQARENPMIAPLHVRGNTYTF
jgi:hypothetical protein